MTDIAQNIAQIQAGIAQACERAERHPDSVQLLAVSKTKPLADIQAAYDAGQRQFGENYVQEAVDKITQLKASGQCPDIEWHFIGPIQSNKTRQVAENADWVQSVDRLKIAKRLNEQRNSTLPQLNVCLQVNISEEDSKSGASAEQVLELAAEVAQMPNLQLRGLMAIPERTDDDASLGRQFLALEQIFQELQRLYPQVDTLSMGMTGDMPLAIEHGSTMVRIGTAIFGERAPKPKS